MSDDFDSYVNDVARISSKKPRVKELLSEYRAVEKSGDYSSVLKENVVPFSSYSDSEFLIDEVLPEKYPVASELCFYGVAGEIAKKACAKSEADEIAVLLTCLTWFSAYVQCEVEIGSIRQPARLFTVLAGRSAKARKGTSVKPIKDITKRLDELIKNDKGNELAYIDGQLSSGEGLVYILRDASDEVDDEGVPIDAGVVDKRLFILEEEFGSALTAASREGNMLSGVIRKFWDDGNVRPITKRERIKVTGADVSFIGHTTIEELLKNLNSVEVANGFANRILWACVKRSKIEPFPFTLSADDVDHYANYFFHVINFVKKNKVIRLNDDALNLWDGMYRKLSVEKSGVIGSITARSEPMVLRIALIFAVLDTSKLITPSHLLAALAVWDYCEKSVEYIFSVELDEYEQKIMSYLKRVNQCKQADITRDVFSNHIKAKKLNSTLKRLEERKKIRREEIKTGGRPTLIWHLISE